MHNVVSQTEWIAVRVVERTEVGNIDQGFHHIKPGETIGMAKARIASTLRERSLTRVDPNTLTLHETVGGTRKW